jgi:hypothetical protein
MYTKPRAKVEDLPDDVQRCVVASFSLAELVAARGVRRAWRTYANEALYNSASGWLVRQLAGTRFRLSLDHHELHPESWAPGMTYLSAEVNLVVAAHGGGCRLRLHESQDEDEDFEEDEDEDTRHTETTYDGVLEAAAPPQPPGVNEQLKAVHGTKEPERGGELPPLSTRSGRMPALVLRRLERSARAGRLHDPWEPPESRTPGVGPVAVEDHEVPGRLVCTHGEVRVLLQLPFRPMDAGGRVLRWAELRPVRSTP